MFSVQLIRYEQRQRFPSTLSRLALGPSQSPVQLVGLPCHRSRVLKCPEFESDLTSASSVQFKCVAHDAHYPTRVYTYFGVLLTEGACSVLTAVKLAVVRRSFLASVTPGPCRPAIVRFAKQKGTLSIFGVFQTGMPLESALH